LLLKDNLQIDLDFIMNEARRRYFELLKLEPTRFENGRSPGLRLLLNPSEIDQVEAEKSLQLEKKSLPSHWAEVGVVFEDQYLRVVRDAVEFPDHSRGTYIRILSRRLGMTGVAILAVRDGMAVMIRQFRHAPREWMREIPRGFIDEGEKSFEAAARELKEETGAVARSLESLGVLHPNSGLLDEKVELFFCDVSGEELAGSREGELDMVDISAVSHLIAEGSITDAFTCAAFFRAAARGLITLHI
jgi:ADP-ribose pyrophosphatase